MKVNIGKHFSPRPVRRWLCLLAAFALAPAGSFAQTHAPAAPQDRHAGDHGHHPAPAGARHAVEIAAPEALIKLNRVELSLADEEVFDQDGRRLRFHADLIKDKVTVVSFIYTSCVYTCTSQGKFLAKLQAALGERLGREVFFVVVSTDPEADTPAKLKSWGETFGAGAGWTFVTGATAPLENLRKRFPGVRAGRDVHEALIFIGNDARGLWVRADSLRPTEEILSLVNSIAAPARAAGE